MSISQYLRKKEYIVTVKNFDDLDSVYDDLETKGKSPPNTEIIRSVDIVYRRPTSRNTHYLLAEWEAEQLKLDPRILSVELAPHERGITPGLNIEHSEELMAAPPEDALEIVSNTSQTSSNWDKSSSTTSTMKNWGLLRCTEGSQRSNWGSSGYEGTGVAGTSAQTGTITLSQIGRNVDVVVCDENGLVWNHPEFAVNADGTGGSRAIQYNWYQHNPVVKGTSAGTYVYGTGSHSTHVAGTVAGNTQGWARAANIYNLYYLAGDESDYNFPYVFDYIREFHRNKSTNPAIGRKNPTIVNNSWGMSIFPNEWSLSDITQVTYRGTTYNSSSGTITYNGLSGVFTSNAKIADLLGFENYGNRITTSGTYTAPGGYVLTKPASWSQEGQQVYLTQFLEPALTYDVTVDGPADIDIIHNVAMDTLTGSMSLAVSVLIKDASNSTIQTYSDTAQTFVGGIIETNINTSYNLPGDQTYTITYTTAYTVGDPGDGGGGGGDGGGGGGDGGGGFNANVTWAVAMSLTASEVESSGPAATVTSITNNIIGAASLTSATAPTNGNNDDGYWTLSLPFNISYFGNTYNTIYVGTNHYLTFTGGSTIYTGISASNPNLPKICWCAADNSVQRIYYGTEGTAPNRTYRVRLEGNASTSGTLGSPNMVCEYTFYENTPAQIDLQLGQNNRKSSTGGGFTTAQLNSWGFISGQRIPARVAAMDADIEDAIAEGIILVGAAGNGRWKHDIPGGLDWDNTFQMNNRYPGETYYYMRGTSPTANDSTISITNICVGSVDTTTSDKKVLYSDCGPGVDIFAPGTYIVSSLPSGTGDPRNSSYYIGKYSGTSMASPQVCGVLACALEVYPYWNAAQAKAYIIGISKSNQLTATSGGPTDGADLQGAPNRFLYYRKERETTGNVFPKTTYNSRPTSGALFPRPRIRRKF